MWYLIEDFFEQSWIMKLLLAWGWLAALIMVTSFVDSFQSLITAVSGG